MVVEAREHKRPDGWTAPCVAASATPEILICQTDGWHQSTARTIQEFELLKAELSSRGTLVLHAGRSAQHRVKSS